MAHDLHLILVNADSAEDAASTAESLIEGWGDENNWRRIGGVASEDGSDDIENHDAGSYGLSFFDGASDATDGTKFGQAVAYLLDQLTDPVDLPVAPHSSHPDLTAAVRALGDQLQAFDPDISGSIHNLWCVGHNLEYLSEVHISRLTLAAPSGEVKSRALSLVEDMTPGHRRRPRELAGTTMITRSITYTLPFDAVPTLRKFLFCRAARASPLPREKR